MKNKAIKVIVIILVVTSIPVGMYELMCGARLRELSRLADKTNAALKASSYAGDEYRANVNGDCLTGNTVFFTYKTTHSYANAAEAKKQFTEKMRQNGLSLSADTSQPRSISAYDNNITGGDTPIRTISLSYNEGDFTHYSYNFTYDTAVPCEVVEDGTTHIMCGGKERDDKMNEILASQPTSSFKASGWLARD